MKDFGKIKCQQNLENKKIIKELIKVNIKKDKNMEKENLFGTMGPTIKEVFKKVCFLDKELQLILIKNMSILVSLKMDKNMETVNKKQENNFTKVILNF